MISKDDLFSLFIETRAETEIICSFMETEEYVV